MASSQHQLVNGIKNGDVVAFEELYKLYYTFLCLISEQIVRDPSDAEEIVSDVFVKLWNIREKLEINTSIKSYLVKAVYNTSLNFLEKSKSRNKLTDSIDDSDYSLLFWDHNYDLGRLFEKEILDILVHNINMLPDCCREIFKLSRNEDMKYSDIADKLGISINTVKTQMKIALSRLREALKDYLMILLLLMGI